jgi:hypothetical protein
VDRRAFVTSAFGTTLLTASGLANAAQRAENLAPGSPDLYIWGQYILRSGAGPRRLGEYLQNATSPR